MFLGNRLKFLKKKKKEKCHGLWIEKKMVRKKGKK